MLEQIVAILPWLVLLVVFVGEKLQQWYITRALDQALQRAQGPASAPPAVPSKVAPTAAPSQPAPETKPLPPQSDGPFADYPLWFKIGLQDIGFHETGDNQGIEKFITQAHCGAVGQPWCAIWTCAKLEQSGNQSPRSPSSQSFRSHPSCLALSGPAKGAIVVFWRISRSSGQGHVGFYLGESATHVWVLGGNEDDMVQIEALPKDSASFGLIGYFWPTSAPLPAIGAVMMPSGSPVSIKTPPAQPQTSSKPAASSSAPAHQTNIVATVFSSVETNNRSTAYGGPLNDSAPGVALPYHFKGARPRVRVTNSHTGQSVDCDIVDVGPWNDIPGDPYWETGTRPQAESGIDQRGRRTNKAGIDLTPGAANAIGIDGKGLVDFDFIQSPDASAPKVT